MNEVFIANFGERNTRWADCLEHGIITMVSHKEVHGFWEAEDKEGYKNACMKHLLTTEGEVPIPGTASRWYGFLDIFTQTDGDLWIHKDGNKLWWTVSTDQLTKNEPGLISSSRILGETEAEVYLFEKKCTGWSCQDKQKRSLIWNGLHPKAKDFLFTEITFQNLSNDDHPEKHFYADYAKALIEGNDLSPWHNLPAWKTKEKKSSRSTVTIRSAPTSAPVSESLTDSTAQEQQASKPPSALENTVQRIVQTVLDTVSNANGQEEIRRVKNKECSLTKDELKDYVTKIHPEQNGKCALTGLQMLLDGEGDDEQLRCSLDRIDSDGHYEEGNLQLVCRFVNSWKSDQKDQEFRRLLKIVRSAPQ